MPDDPKQTVRLAIAHLSAATTLFVAGIGAVKAGYVPLGLALMVIAFLCLIWELFTSKPIAKNVPGMMRLLIAVFAGAIFLGTNRVTINGFFGISPTPSPTPTPSPSPSPTKTPTPMPSAAEIAAELAKLVPQQESERTEITKLRGDAISVINGLYSLYGQWEKRDHSLQGRLISDVSEARQKGVQFLRDNNNKEISDRYFRDYHSRAVSIRDSLLGHIPHSPTRRNERADESYFPMQGRDTIWSTDIATQTCDLIKLLNEMESEHGLQPSVADIRQSLYCH